MLNLYSHPSGGYCDGVSRRNFLKIGGLAMGGLSLPELLKAEAEARTGRSFKSVIMIYMCGAPPHQDMYDLKIDAPAELGRLGLNEHLSSQRSNGLSGGMVDLGVGTLGAPPSR